MTDQPVGRKSEISRVDQREKQSSGNSLQLFDLQVKTKMAQRLSTELNYRQKEQEDLEKKMKDLESRSNNDCDKSHELKKAKEFFTEAVQAKDVTHRALETACLGLQELLQRVFTAELAEARTTTAQATESDENRQVEVTKSCKQQEDQTSSDLVQAEVAKSFNTLRRVIETTPELQEKIDILKNTH